MPIIFNSDIKKASAHDEVLRKLRRFLDASEPELVHWLVHIWNTQARAITYKELRESILAGTLAADVLMDWQQDYSKFVVNYMLPAWTLAMEESTKQLSRRYPTFAFDATTYGVKQWIDTKAASFVTNCTMDQINAINAVVGRAAVIQDMTVDGLARAIRPMVGLTKQQAEANLRYYTSLVERGISEKAALDKSIRYSARQHRYRGYNIARTELAFAYNKGEHFAVQQAISEGYMGHTVKVWCTADDERVCPICGALEGKEIEMDADFDFRTKLERNNPGIKMTPPAHPSCRCTILYKEVSPP